MGEDHPRVCGENKAPDYHMAAEGGSPPRVRGKHYVHCPVLEERRITPACAGKTLLTISLGTIKTDHPRVCGENLLIS